MPTEEENVLEIAHLDDGEQLLENEAQHADFESIRADSDDDDSDSDSNDTSSSSSDFSEGSVASDNDSDESSDDDSDDSSESDSYENESEIISTSDGHSSSYYSSNYSMSELSSGHYSSNSSGSRGSSGSSSSDGSTSGESKVSSLYHDRINRDTGNHASNTSPPQSLLSSRNSGKEKGGKAEGDCGDDDDGVLMNPAYTTLPISKYGNYSNDSISNSVGTFTAQLDPTQAGNENIYCSMFGNGEKGEGGSQDAMSIPSNAQIEEKALYGNRNKKQAAKTMQQEKASGDPKELEKLRELYYIVCAEPTALSNGESYSTWIHKNKHKHLMDEELFLDALAFLGARIDTKMARTLFDEARSDVLTVQQFTHIWHRYRNYKVDDEQLAQIQRAFDDLYNGIISEKQEDGVQSYVHLSGRVVLAATGATPIHKKEDEDEDDDGTVGKEGKDGKDGKDGKGNHSDDDGSDDDGSDDDRGSTDGKEEKDGDSDGEAENKYVGVRDPNDFTNQDTDDTNAIERRNTGGRKFIVAEDLRKLLITMGDKLTDEEADLLINESMPSLERDPSQPNSDNKVKMIFDTNFRNMLLPGSS